MANPNPQPLGAQAFGHCFFTFPTGGIGGDYPAGGNPVHYSRLQRGDILSHDLGAGFAIIENHLAAEAARLGLNIKSPAITPARDQSKQAFMQAWNASHHLTSGNGLSNFHVPRAMREYLSGSRWPTTRQNIFNQIAAANTGAPAPAAILQLPGWYVAAQAAATGVAPPAPAPVPPAPAPAAPAATASAPAPAPGAAALVAPVAPAAAPAAANDDDDDDEEEEVEQEESEEEDEDEAANASE